MKHISEFIDKHVDFNFALAIIAILGTAGSLYLQFSEANTEFDTLNASMHTVIRGQERGVLRENASINNELDELGKSLDMLILK
ncbi:MAG: hypothetical protein A3I26_02080 [Candidatus Yanofskybacteria bacterium RIFCSPLOWO2_02_FULL_43_10]|uniref:Uncharacterized protein n=1 Tax=Candidatus Yanofskybacteria bacterium RIFCSPLOWO2_12_FULL_43_11b TaxID=1802710 RepID=A0A1F8H703_9BACT|nr:MAG: hypothetical protein A2742_02465 [Candidatus Yanofskybacteria bacterium RIFCSPHIGHO2_01_FULL_43_32]OGN11555.1 MAG: hypothetical protein A3C69_03805 [Candidatus Yanofskybacteria bacterium RIFCSPHIGHO2_02_FULL_43_12]OGN17403.1 MAG: hypothetical protein A3E34_00985 [Candidatus Yanofskybacteria bacterium RIFCSPHIGHO2_12_FULL_43_11]OGN24892.1 MAG: hypothetical protein A2923_01285 [Candidatus Yanofskybacteria bacterium RIFCSPLOWO2_01_FULL_43_46]OGN30258.1 MAG: hypothetical protein A3I26_02080